MIFPSKCINCNQVGEIICDSCLYNCELLTAQNCIVCDKEYFEGQTHLRCIQSLKYKRPSQVISVFVYKDLVRECIKTSKYGSKQFSALKKLTYSAIQILKEWEVNFEDYVCISIPSSKKTYRKRGFNQSEIISEVIAKYLNLETKYTLLDRVKETQAQYTLDRKDRFENLKDAFYVKNKDFEYLKDKKVLLVDDVVTTGATLLEISNLLYNSGVLDVKCLTLAKRVKQRNIPIN